MKRLIAALLFVPLVGACGDSTGPAGTAPVELSLATVSTTSAVNAGGASFAMSALETAALTIPANEGVFEIADVQFIVSEFELEGTETCTTTDEDGETEIDECEFEGGPHLVSLPLDGGAISLGTGHITEGTYTYLEFEVEDLEMDEEDADDSEKQAALAAILTDVQATYPDFPAGASMVVSGQYVPDTGDAQPFTVYFAAEIEIEMVLDPALEIPANDALTINVDPSAWLTGFDLLAADGQLVEFELEMEDGFVEIEIDDED
ncbi:MAG: hypothetical protein R6U63_02045 [Longimicrobiales bacterium]